MKSDRHQVEHIIHGVRVPDNFGWLEERDSLSTRQWLGGQATLLRAYFSQLSGFEALRDKVMPLLDVDAIDQIGSVRGRTFYRRRVRGAEQPSIFLRDYDGTQKRLIDPTQFGPYMTVNIHSVSNDASLLAYELKSGGEHSKELHIVDVNSGTVLADHLARGLTRGFAFDQEGNGYWYSHDFLDDSGHPNGDHTINYHKFGQHLSSDQELFRLRRIQESKLVLRSDGTRLYALFYRPAFRSMVADLYKGCSTAGACWQRIATEAPLPFTPIVHYGRLFVFSQAGSPNGAIVELDPDTGHEVRTVVPEYECPPTHFVIASGRLYVSYIKASNTELHVWSLEGTLLGRVPLEQGYSWRMFPTCAPDADDLFLQRESFASPPQILKFPCERHTDGLIEVFHGGSSTLRRRVDDIVYRAKDNTEISMSLVRSDSSDIQPPCPIIMTSYGGFGQCLTPQFSVLVTVLLDLGFIFAMPKIRGGGDRGKQWHEAARGRRRQVSFDDFIAAAEWLCDKGYGAPNKFGIFGGSNSGLLVAAAITQRPDLFRAAICVAPILDMLRYHLFDRASGWREEYGTADDPEDFAALFAYSPYHHVQDNTNYPAVLFVSGDKDTRCNGAHARKMTALLQDRTAQVHPVLLDYSDQRGHSPSMPISVRVESLTRRVAFICHELGVPVEEP